MKFNINYKSVGIKTELLIWTDDLVNAVRKKSRHPLKTVSNANTLELINLLSNLDALRFKTLRFPVAPDIS